MPKFKNLFSFSQSEIDTTFKSAKQLKSMLGLKLLQAPMLEKQEHGKLLIITPRAVGKAHIRNLIRRQLKAIFYENRLYAFNGKLIILVYKPAIELSFNQLRLFLTDACKSLQTI